jgi:hypothetical protein
MNPALRMIARDGDLSLECEPAATEGDLLIDLPPELLIPTEELVFTDSAEELRLADEPGGLTSVQRELLDLHFDLSNASDKIPVTETSRPRRNLHRMPGSVEILQRFRPGFPTTAASPRPCPGQSISTFPVSGKCKYAESDRHASVRWTRHKSR